MKTLEESLHDILEEWTIYPVEDDEENHIPEYLHCNVVSDIINLFKKYENRKTK